MSEPVLLLTPEQAADRLNIGRTTLYALMNEGELESVKIKRLRLIPAAALNEYVERLRSQAKDGAS